MRKEIDYTKSMQLLKGSKVKCIKSVPVNELVTKTVKNCPEFDFTMGKEYPVEQANMLIGDAVGGHTFSIDFFRQHFVELPHAQL